MRKDVKLGLAVGGILFGAVLVYVLFFAGGNPNKIPNNQQALAPVPQIRNSANTDPQSTGTHTETTHVGSTPNYADSTGIGNPTVAIGGPATRPADAASTVTAHSAPSGPPSDAVAASSDTVTRSGAWDWRQALDRGAGADLLSRSATPHDSTPSTDPTTERTATTDWRAALTGTESTAGHSPIPSRIHLVKPGETLWSIAKAEYGNAAYVSHLLRANPKLNPNRVQAGQKLVIPSKADVVPTNPQTPPPQANKPLDPTKEYRVQAGDSLTTICKRLYGSAAGVAKLYELNKQLIGPNPSALKVNMVLRLAEAPNAKNAETTPSAMPVAGSLQ